MENKLPQTKQQATVAYLEQLDYKKLADSEIMQNKFVQLYNDIHGSNRGSLVFEKEKFNFLKSISESTELQQATSLSLYGCFLDIAVLGLSLDKGSKPLAYMLTRNAKTKDKEGKDKYEKRAYVEVSPYGELAIRIRAGQIKHADNPVIVYDCDKIRIGLNAQLKRTVLEYEAKIPRSENAKIVGGFIRVERHDGSYEVPWMDIADVDRLIEYSEKNNAKWDKEQNKKVKGQANALYYSNNGQIDTGFFEAKIIKHAFRAYPKVRTGEFTSLATDSEPEAIDYGLNQTQQQLTEKTETVDKIQEAQVLEPKPTGSEISNNSGITVTIHSDDETF